MRLERIVPGRRPPDSLVGAVLTRDLVIGGQRWSKGRRLSRADLDHLGVHESGGDAVPMAGLTTSSPADAAIPVLVLEAGDVHEDDAALRLAHTVTGGGLVTRGPIQSRVDLLAQSAGVVHVRVATMERLNRIDPLEVFTVLNGQVVEAGELVASVKIAPHVVPAAVLERAQRVVAREGSIVRVAPFVARRVGVLVKESVPSAARERFERSVHQKIEGLGSRIDHVVYVDDDPDVVTAALARMTRGGQRVDLVLTAGAGSTNPADAIFVAIERLGGRIVRHGVPAHPGSMLWLARIGRAAVLGLPTCGAYSKATAADLVLPRLLTGEPASARLVAGLGHGGILTREMRFRFPAYARDLEAPEG